MNNNRKKGSKKKFIILGICEIIALSFIFCYAFIFQKYSNIQRLDFALANVRNNDISVESVKKMQGYWNIAVFGVDSRTNSIGKGNNSDVIILVRIDRSTGAIKLVSVYRDTYLDVGKGKYAKINNAYCVGGPEQAVMALNRNLDLNITDYVTFNWKAVATIVNILGGVDINVTKGEFRYINSYITETVKSTNIGSKQLAAPGMQHLDGIQAVAYSRLRYSDSDFVRTERQREVIRQCLEKAKKLSASQLNEIMDYMLPLIATNLTVSDGLSAIADIKNYHIEDTAGFPFSVGDVDMGSKGWNVIPTTLVSNVKQLHEFLFDAKDYEPTKTVRNIGDKVAYDSKMYKEGKYVKTYGIKETVTDDSESGTDIKNNKEITEKQDNTDSKKANYEIDKEGNIIWLKERNSDGSKYVPTEEELKKAEEDAKRVKNGETVKDVNINRNENDSNRIIEDVEENDELHPHVEDNKAANDTINIGGKYGDQDDKNGPGTKPVTDKNNSKNVNVTGPDSNKVDNTKPVVPNPDGKKPVENKPVENKPDNNEVSVPGAAPADNKQKAPGGDVVNIKEGPTSNPNDNIVAFPN